MSAINTKAVLKYAILPGIIPRLRRFFASGFGHTAYMMAFIYNMVRLLPDNHPYLLSKNIGKFGIRHVIAAAANNLTLSKKNLDQIVIFIVLLVGVVLLGLMLAATVIGLVFGHAFAQPAPIDVASMFVTREPRNDIAFMLLDQVFGVPNFFNSCVATATACFPGQNPGTFPWPFHRALQEMFRFYSSGILFIGMLIFFYFLLVIVVETATSGTPFGQRFKNMWVPVRLVVAIGLLLPLNYGYNSAQYIVFGAAKFGSSFATNTWLVYNRTLGDRMGEFTYTLTGEKETLVGLPRPPDMASLAQMMSIVHTCAFAYWYEDEVVKQKTREKMPDDEARYQRYRIDNKIKPYMVKNVQAWMEESPLITDKTAVTRLYGGNPRDTTYEDAMGFYGRGDIIIRFGRLNDKDRSGSIGPDENVDPLCGDIRIKINDPRMIGDQGIASGGDLPGAVQIQKLYFEMIKSLWFDAQKSANYLDFAGRSYLLAIGLNNDYNDACSMGCNPPNPNLPSGGCPASGQPAAPNAQCREEKIPAAWKQDAANKLQIEFDSRLKEVWMNYNENNIDSYMTPEILKYGWGGAGIWFNKIAHLNGSFIGAVANHPRMDKYPLVMENVREHRRKTESDNSATSQFDPETSINKQIEYSSEAGTDALPISIGLSRVHQYWNTEGANLANSEKVATTGAIETAINFMFGTKGLFSMREENAHIHPLAQLVSLGKNLVDNAIGAVAGSTVISALGGLLGGMKMSGGPLAGGVSGLIMATAFVGLTAGIVLFYVLPFLPFVFFYFAVASWLKTIFEAMVGVPLWALAHLRIDGEGLPGDAASNGYYLILEIFLRPVMTVIAMIGALVIFTAQVRILHFVWDLVIQNVGGYPDDNLINLGAGLSFKRTIIDQFFYTVLYAIVVYMMATASFKLIDKIPDDILRWLGSGASSFSDINQDPVGQLTQKVAIGGLTTSDQITGGIQQLGGGLGTAVGGAIARTTASGSGTPPQGGAG